MYYGRGRNRTSDVSIVGDLQSLVLAARHTYPCDPDLFLLTPRRKEFLLAVLFCEIFIIKLYLQTVLRPI